MFIVYDFTGQNVDYTITALSDIFFAERRGQWAGLAEYFLW
jgi:hypothetical protein